MPIFGVYKLVNVFEEIINALPMQLLKTLLTIFKKKPLQDPRSESMRSLPNEFFVEETAFGNKPIVIYYEPYPVPLIRNIIRKKYAAIQQSLQLKQIEFFDPYLPADLDKKEMFNALQYFNPQIHDIGDELSSFKKYISDGKQLGNLLGLPAINKPAFILGSPGKKASSFDFFVYYLPEDNPALISKSIQYYLSTLVIPTPIPEDVITTTEKREYIQASAGNRNFTEINKDADELFDDASSALTNQLRKELETELIRNQSKGAVRILLHVINRMKAMNMATDPNLINLVNKLENEEDVKLSRLFVPLKGNIKLLDYDLEIPLSHLDKALYIFFLLHEEGIQFKDLGNYKYELTTLYAKVTNRISKEKFEKSMEDLSNPFSNSVNEKCSRIRRVFVGLLDERIAKNYYITKGRSENKRITLDRSLVVFEDENLYS